MRLGSCNPGSASGHKLNRSQQLVVRAVQAVAFWRHGINAFDSVLQGSVQTFGQLVIPGSLVAFFRGTQYAHGVASHTGGVVNLFTGTRFCGGGYRSATTVSTHTHSANRLDAVTDFVGLRII